MKAPPYQSASYRATSFRGYGALSPGGPIHPKQRTETALPTSDLGSNSDSPHEIAWPLGRGHMVSQKFSLSKPHFGIDITGSHSTPIMAAHAGTVVYTGNAFSGYGRLIIVDNGYGWSTFYAHLSKVKASQGQRVRRGEIIGTMGKTGNAEGVHLHFELRYKKAPIDPVEYLP